MQKEVSTLSTAEMEDLVFLSLLKEAEKSPKGSLNKVKAHLKKLFLQNEN